MKIKILSLIFLAIFNKFYSQEKIDINSIYFENGIAINKLNNQIFTGFVQNKNKKGHIKFEEIYENGKLSKSLLYYNIDNPQVVATETFYNAVNNKKIKTLNFSLDGKTIRETIFDENEKKSEFNSYKNKNLILHEKYNNGKRNGKWFCLNDDGSTCVTEYLNGKKIKDRR